MAVRSRWAFCARSTALSRAAIAAATEANHAALKQTSQAAQTLDALAESLRDSVSRFKA